MLTKIKAQLNHIARFRELLKQAQDDGATFRASELLLGLTALNSELVDLLQAEIAKASDTSRDQALVFCEFSPDGTIMPLDWIPTLRRHSREPLTYIRVDESMIQDVNEVINE